MLNYWKNGCEIDNIQQFMLINRTDLMMTKIPLRKIL